MAPSAPGVSCARVAGDDGGGVGGRLSGGYRAATPPQLQPNGRALWLCRPGLLHFSWRNIRIIYHRPGEKGGKRENTPRSLAEVLRLADAGLAHPAEDQTPPSASAAFPQDSPRVPGLQSRLLHPQSEWRGKRWPTQYGSCQFFTTY